MSQSSTLIQRGALHAAALSLIARWAGPARAASSSSSSSKSTATWCSSRVPSLGCCAPALLQGATVSSSLWQQQQQQQQQQRHWSTIGGTTAEHQHQHEQRRASSSAARSDPADGGGGGSTIVDPELLSLLACPLTKQPLVVADVVGKAGGDDAHAAGFLLSRAAGARFPVGRDGVPRLRPLQDGELVVAGVDDDDDDVGAEGGGDGQRR
jgi:uncharacterized protein YbaR (Trm112 family)